MPWIEGSHQRTFTVNIALDEAADFMADPARLKRALVSLDRAERVDEQTYRWILKEIGAKNITFQGDYTVRYERQGNRVAWESVKDTGNMRTKGTAEFVELGEGKTQITYEETMASDLPVPRLAAKVFRPIVAREVTRGIDEFIDSLERTMNSGAHLGDEQ